MFLKVYDLQSVSNLGRRMGRFIPMFDKYPLIWRRWVIFHIDNKEKSVCSCLLSSPLDVVCDVEKISLPIHVKNRPCILPLTPTCDLDLWDTDLICVFEHFYPLNICARFYVIPSKQRWVRPWKRQKVVTDTGMSSWPKNSSTIDLKFKGLHFFTENLPLCSTPHLSKRIGA